MSIVTFGAIGAACVAALACWIAARSHTRLARGTARVARLLGFFILLWGGVGTLSSIVAATAASDSPGLSDADRSSIRADGYREAAQNLLIGVLLSGPPLLAALWLTRQLDARSS